MNCPKCSKELKYVPKGKCICACGEVVYSDGRDVEKFKISNIKLTIKDHLPSFVEILLIFAIILPLGLIAIRVMYQKTWVQHEAAFIFKTFGIDQEFYKEVIARLVPAVLIILWLAYNGYRKLRKNITNGSTRRRGAALR